MHQIYQQEENIPSKLNSLLAMYRCLHFSQLCRIFPKLSITQLTLLLKKLERKGRIFLDSKKDLVYYAGITEANPAILSSFWVLLDFYPEVNYHTVSDYPVTLSFTATDDCFDVIFIPLEKEQILNQALSFYKEGYPKRIVVVENVTQISLLSIPGTIGYCTVSEEGQITYYTSKE